MSIFESTVLMEYESWRIATETEPLITTYFKGVRVSPKQGTDIDNVNFDFIDAIYLQFVTPDVIVTTIICKGEHAGEVSTVIHYEEI